MTKTLERVNFLLGTDYATLDWDYISKYQNLSEDFIREFKDEVNWDYISAHQKLSDGFIREFKDEVNWGYFSEYQKLSDGFIREFKDEVNWECVSQYQKLSDGFIREFKDKVNWEYVSTYQKLSEDFIREFKDEVNWEFISRYQKLSEDFIREFKDEVNWEYVSRYQKLSDGFIEEFKNRITLLTQSWLYETKEVKKKAIEDCGLYELDGDYVIAYKGVRSDGYSAYNFQYHYEPGEIYESHCDFNLNDENSFGLSAWTLESAKSYCPQLVFKVKIHISDVGALVHGCHKIRASKILILEQV